MKGTYYKLIENNKKWVEENLNRDPLYFENLAKGQSPEFLWVGCSDSRMPANEITGTRPGEMFVHRNIANMVVHTDMNFMSVLQYAVEVLKVKHIIVCGHYGCGGVQVALSNKSAGNVNKWLRNIKEVYAKYSGELDQIINPSEKANRLVELNVIEQVKNLAKSSIVQRAWKERELQIHGWVYGIHNGIIKELGVRMNDQEDLEPIFRYEIN